MNTQLQPMPPQNHTKPMIDAIRTLVETTRMIDTRKYEESDVDVIRSELVPTIEQTLANTTRLLIQVSDYYDAQNRDQEVGTWANMRDISFETSIDQLVSNGTASRQIADISFIAHLELSRKRQQLTTLRVGTSAWEFISVCASIRRNVLKAASALERVMCEYEGYESQCDWYLTATRRALSVRRAYAIFRKSIGPNNEPDEDTIHARVRGAGVALAKLIGREIYEEFKIRDRQMLRETRNKIIAWLRENPPRGELNVRSGVRLWQDTVGLANLLMQVNNRTELIDHDNQVLSDLYETLFRSFAAPRRLTRDQLLQLRKLYGRDDELDQCIEQGDGCAIELWRTPIARLCPRGARESH